MVELNSEKLDAVFTALGDPTRRQMLRRLADGECTISELAEPFAMSFAGASKHVKMLENAGLLRRTVQGRSHVCSLQAAPLSAAEEWLRFYENFWGGRLDALARELEKSTTGKRRKR
ncbi:MAG TPA: metalloregulator ArsR/SmtB family transcription factor [Oxalicibacterium sp.]|uniref:ArsR/SmtB family transcription factor n=1 Tax=Oxalicibacterium sp. TaxID=2766525 RepID=UPI002B579167|nr:metalloregulator ArsR/SmtB family transcription factor [Oxalicibacterium sp.]HWU97544.1 metalloregulator ArsR/SmtB family transcription factor [Oxalicibacterium sp.]